MGMKRGDQYKIIIPYDIKDDDDVEIAITDVESIQFCINKLVKEYPNEVTYNSTDKEFEFPVTESETYDFPVGKAPCQMRVHFADGTIKSSDVVYENVGQCLIAEEVGTDAG